MALEATMATYKYSAGTIKDVFAWLNRLGTNNEHVARLKAKYKNAGVEKLQGTGLGGALATRFGAAKVPAGGSIWTFALFLETTSTR
jgi:hypothetical protein